MGMINNSIIKKNSVGLAALFLSVCVLSTSTLYANNSQEVIKDQSLVAFYNQVFGKNQKSHFPKEVVQKAKIKINKKRLNENCISYQSGTETQFAIDLRKQKQQKNLQLLMSDNNITSQTDHVKNEISRIENIDTEVFLDLVQANENKAYMTLGSRKVHCKKKIQAVKPNKPKPKKVKKLEKIIKKAKPIPEVKAQPKTLISSPPKKQEKAIIKKLADTKPWTPPSKGCSATSTTSGNANDMSALFAKAFGGTSKVSKPSKISSNLRVDKTVLGDIDLFSDKSGNMDEADTEVLLKLLEEVLKDHVFLRISKELSQTKKTRFCKLNELGIATFYNSTNLSLDLEIKPEFRKPFILSLRNKKKASVREENKVEAEKINGFLNAYTNVGLNSGGDDAELRMRLEGSLNINGFVLETTGDYRGESFDLGRTTLTYDRPEKLHRFSIGNIAAGNRNFQESLELDGIRISKEFFLDPDLQISPRANESLQLDTNSEVELYINNQLIRRFYLNAGVYALEDIGLYNGANNIRIRIKDEFGKITVKKSKQYYDSHLLKPGLSLFAVSVGYLSNQQSSSNEESENKLIFSGYYQKGISKDLTLSLDAQFSSDNYLFGAETISSIPLGSLKNSIAVSGGTERETGYATSFEFRPNKKQEQISLDTLRQDLLGLDTRSRGFLNNWTITGEYRSEDFSTFNGITDQTVTSQSVDGVNFENRVFNSNKLKGNLQTNFSLNINEKWRGNLNLGVADYYDSDESYYANLSATKRFDNGVRLSLGGRYDTEDKFSMNLQLSVPLSRKKGKKKIDLDVLADSRNNAYETKLNVKPSSLVGKNSLAGSLEYFENTNSKQQLFDVQYRNNLFESKLTARNRMAKASGNSTQQLNFGFNAGLACVGGSCAASYPINDSFALVSGPSNQTQAIAISTNGLRFKYSEGNDTGLPDSYTALIANKNRKAVVRLESYRSQNINIDEGTLPNGYDAEKTEFSVFPKYHQGFLLKAGGEPATTLDGMLIDDSKKALSFKGGQWVPINEGKTVAFFSNKGGKFRVTSIPAGKYKLDLFDYPDMKPIYIDVPDTKGKPHDIGNLIIKTPN